MAIRITTRRRTVSEDNLIEKDGIMISTPLVEGFDEVYKRNYTRLSQYAFHIIHDKGDAEDLANEAFLVYYQHADEMDIENPDAYLFKILRNLIGNYIKRRDLTQHSHWIFWRKPQISKAVQNHWSTFFRRG